MRNMVISLVIAFVCLAVGCDNGKSSPEPTKQAIDKTSAPATLSFYAVANSITITDQEFQNTILKPIQQKYPNYQMNYVKKEQGATLPELATAGKVPDIIMGTFGDLAVLNNLQIATDLQPLIKSNGFDLGRIDSEVLEVVKRYSPDGQILFIPYAVNTAALYYNKDIFDKFAVPYPKDGMTWDEAVDLAQKLTRVDGGVQYQGFDMDHGFLMNNNQLSVGYIAMNEERLNSDQLKPWFAAMRRFYEFPSLSPESRKIGKRDSFLKEKTVAMFAGGSMLNLLQQAPDLNWDMVSLPTFKEAPGVGLIPNTPFYVISSTSKQKEEAFHAITVLLSDEAQMSQTRNGLLTVLKNPEIKKQVMQDTPFKNKHTEALYMNKFAKPRYISEYDQFVKLPALFVDMITNQKDINTAFREAEEGTKSLIEQYKAGQTK